MESSNASQQSKAQAFKELHERPGIFVVVEKLAGVKARLTGTNPEPSPAQGD